MAYEIHQMEGIDPTGRMFSRDVAIDVDENGYMGHFAYEGIVAVSDPYPTPEDVLQEISWKLRTKRFSALRSRLNFQEDRYFAERKPWVHYDDPLSGPLQNR